MALYDIKHVCGHETEQQIYGTNVRGEREAEAERRGRKLCPACYKKQQEAPNRAAAEQADREGWPALQGSEKQIAWANQIRVKAVESLTESVRINFPDRPELVPLATTVILEESDHSSWWIDRRDRRTWLGIVRRDSRWEKAIKTDLENS